MVSRLIGAGHEIRHHGDAASITTRPETDGPSRPALAQCEEGGGEERRSAVLHAGDRWAFTSFQFVVAAQRSVPALPEASSPNPLQ